MEEAPIGLMVDDDRGVRALYAAVFARLGVPVRSAGSIAEARAELHAWTPRLVVLDVRLPDGCGLELLPDIQAAGDPPVIFATAAATQREIGLVERYAFRILRKPFDLGHLQAAIEAACSLQPAAL